jgi:hypothetical protein
VSSIIDGLLQGAEYSQKHFKVTVHSQNGPVELFFSMPSDYEALMALQKEASEFGEQFTIRDGHKPSVLPEMQEYLSSDRNITTLCSLLSLLSCEPTKLSPFDFLRLAKFALPRFNAILTEVMNSLGLEEAKVTLEVIEKAKKD